MYSFFRTSVTLQVIIFKILADSILLKNNEFEAVLTGEVEMQEGMYGDSGREPQDIQELFSTSFE